MYETRFVVERAGCESCATRVRDALSRLATVRAVDVDEEADVARVRLASTASVTQEAVASALREASVGTGHAYRLQSGTWGV